MSSNDAALKKRLEQMRAKNQQQPKKNETVSSDDAAIKKAMQDLKRKTPIIKTPPPDPSIKSAIVTIKVFGVGGGGNSVLKRIAES